MTLIFLLTYCPDSEECFSYPDHVFEMISHHSAVIWSKSFRQKVWKSDFWTNQKIVSWAFFRPSFQQFRPFPAIFSFLRVVWLWFFYWRIARTLRNVFHTQIMLLKWFPTILRSFEAKVFEKKSEKVAFGQVKKSSLEHFLGPLFNSFVHFLQYFHFYASYDSDFFTDVLPWLWGMFFIPRSCFWNDFPPFCGHLKQKFSTKSLKKWLLDKPKNCLLSIF